MPLNEALRTRTQSIRNTHTLEIAHYLGACGTAARRSASWFNSHSRAKAAASAQFGVWSSSGGSGAEASIVAIDR
jgi:hypothetical protein